MNIRIRPGAPLVSVLLLAAAALGAAWPGTAAGARYVCPPCGQPCDTASFAAPGACPACGMALVEQDAAAAPAPPDFRRRVAILVFPGAEILDFSGPYEMFGAAGCDVYTVAASRDPVTTAMGLVIVPRYTFADAPRPDVLVVPGGGVGSATHSEATLQYVRDVTAHDRNTLSVCNGAFILASAGLLDGLRATTTDGNLARLESQFPKVHVVRDQRFVDNGTIVTTAGLSAGMDGALHVIGKLFGTGQAEAVALVEEYDWRAGAGFVRAALADHEIPELHLEALGTWDVVRTHGDTGHWDVVTDGRITGTLPDLVHHIERGLEQGHWRRVGAEPAGPAPPRSTWSFTGRDGKPWKGTLKVAPSPATDHVSTVAISVARTRP